MDELDSIIEIFGTNGIDRIDYQYFHQLLHNRTIVFNQHITNEVIENVFLPLRDFENDDSEKPVTLILNCEGGSVSDSFFLANYLTHYSKPLTILVTGYAASMATVLLAAGGKNNNITRVCYPSTYALIHDGYIAIAPSESKTAGDMLAFNDQVDQQIRDFILANTKITPELYDSQTRHQWFLTADQMLELGLIDKILE